MSSAAAGHGVPIGRYIAGARADSEPVTVAIARDDLHGFFHPPHPHSTGHCGLGPWSAGKNFSPRTVVSFHRTPGGPRPRGASCRAAPRVPITTEAP